MKLNELNINIQNEFDNWLSQIGFKGEAVLSGYTYNKKLEWGNQMFGFSYVNYGESHLVMVSQGYISFDKVESILRNKFRLYKYSFQKSDITFSNIFKPTTDTRNVNIYSLSDFKKLVPIWTRDIKEKVLPFFEQWSNLKMINDEIIEKITAPELPNYIPGETSFKKMIIMKLCNNANYQSYLTKREEVLSKAKESDPQKYQPYYDLFMELKAELKNVEPIY